MASPEDKQKHSRRRKNHVQRDRTEGPRNPFTRGDLYKRFKEKDHSVPVDKKEKYPKRYEEISESEYDDDCI